MNRFLYLLILLFVTQSGITQEQLGLKLDNFGGVNTILLNPAQGVFSPFSWDVNLVGADVFVENDYAFFENTYLPEVLRQLENEIEVRPEIGNESEIDPNALIVDFYRENKKRFLAVATNVTGPSALVQLPKQQSVGILTRARFATYAQQIPASFNYYNWDELPNAEEINITPMQLTAMAWNEVGIHYSKAFETYNGKVAIGTNVKFLQGYESVYVAAVSSFRIQRLPNDSLSASRLSLAYGFTNENITANEFNLQRNGIGFGVDLGVSFTIEEYADSYRWRIGASLQDIGQINFNRNAESYVLQADSLVEVVSSAYEQFDNIDQLDDAITFFNQDVLGDTLVNNIMRSSFKVGLPAAFSLQVDYAINENFYLNTTYVQRISGASAALQRGNLLAFTPRFEHRWFSASVPVATYNWQDFRIGLALRMAFLTIGSDNLGSIIGRSDFTGTDLYLALKINPFKVNFGSKSKRKRGKVVCPAISR
ncbi:MAG: DUF5723 family protein [Saprospiraceae bacterium]